MTLQPHQQRVVEETAELGDRLEKLLVFLKTDKFKEIDALEQRRLTEQSVHMQCYFVVLTQRIAAF